MTGQGVVDERARLTRELAVMKMLAAGRDMEYVAAALPAPVRALEVVARSHGWPHRPAAAAVAELTARLRASDSPRVLPVVRSGRRVEKGSTLAEDSRRRISLGPAGGSLPVDGDEGRALLDLLAWADAAADKRIRQVAAHVRAHLDVLARRRKLLAERESAQAARRVEREAARAEVAELREQLAAVRAKLRQSSGRSAGLSREDSLAVRKWAASQGLKCARAGRIPRPVVEAWRRSGGRGAGS